MKTRRAVAVALPVLLMSLPAFAQQADGKKDDPQQQQQGSGDKATKKAEPKKQPKKEPKKDEKVQQGLSEETQGQSPKGQTQKGVPQHKTTVLGQDVENKDSDLDVSVGKTQTTSAEQQPARPDVIESRAEERREAEGRRWSAAPLFGYGTNDYNVGLGARAGYTFPTPVYVGGTFMYHFGSDNVGVGPEGSTRTRESFYYPGVEVGYDIGVGPVLVRPYGGAAIMFDRKSTSLNSVTASDTQSTLMIYPAVSAQYILPRSPVFVGGDMRVLIPFENAGGSFQVFATAGLSM